MHLYPNMRHLLNIIRNKYLLSAVAFGTWCFFFDKNDLPSQISRTQELKELNAKIRYYKEQIRITGNELKDLQSDPATLERYAREKYFMKKENEDVFIAE